MRILVISDVYDRKGVSMVQIDIEASLAAFVAKMENYCNILQNMQNSNKCTEINLDALIKDHPKKYNELWKKGWESLKMLRDERQGKLIRLMGRQESLLTRLKAMAADFEAAREKAGRGDPSFEVRLNSFRSELKELENHLEEMQFRNQLIEDRLIDEIVFIQQQARESEERRRYDELMIDSYKALGLVGMRIDSGWGKDVDLVNIYNGGVCGFGKKY